MNSIRTTLQSSTLHLTSTVKSSSSQLQLRLYSKTPNRRKRLSPSFKPGPFTGALLDQTTATKTQVEQDIKKDYHPSNPSIQHDYSPSQLLKSLKQNVNASSSKLHFPHSDLIKNHLNDLLFPLNFHDQIACRMVSSKNLIKSQDSLHLIQSASPGGVGFAILGEHNSKLSFIGRRMMHFALSNFLLHAPRIEGTKKGKRHEKMMEEVIEEALLTKFVLGQYVGHQWELEKIMRWRELTPSSSSDTSHPLESKPKIPISTGLWTARGHVVEAIIGGVMTQYGARLSNAIFNSLVLPHLSFRLDKSYIPAIKAIQAHDKELENPKAGLVDWNQLDIQPFISEDLADYQLDINSDTPMPIAAVG